MESVKYGARLKFWAWLIVALFMLLVSKYSHAQISPNTNNSNLGFETGTTQNWTISNGTGTAKTSPWSDNGEGVQTTTGMNNYSPDGQKSWTVTPYGTYMLAIQAGGGAPNFDPAMSSLGLTTTQVTEIKNYLTGLGGNSSPTNAAWAKRTVALETGKTYVIAWQYMSTDYVPFNDGSMMTLTHTTDSSKIPTLNNSTKNYALLGFTNPGTGNYATDSYGSTGWQLATITVPVTGDYVLGFASFNLGDTALSPILFVDDLQGATFLNGTTFGPIAPNAGSTAPTTGGSTAPTCPNNSTCSTTPFNANLNFSNRASAFAAGNIDNKVVIQQIGSNSNITAVQIGKKNYIEINSIGSNNLLDVRQGVASGTTASNYIELTLSSGNNEVSTLQNSTGGNKGILMNVAGTDNIIGIEQKNNGNHYAEVTLTGGSKNVQVVQEGSGNHMAKIELSGGATSITTTQSGSTSQSYSITHSCAQISCAAITVTQGQ
jgi:fibronectin-binding autotransporter adhesin